MTNYVFIYHAPATPADAPQPSPEQMAAVMGVWMTWAGTVGEGMVDFGTPLDGGVRVTPEGTSPSDREVTGYSIIEAADMDAALGFARNHPHLSMPGGCTIEVHEALPVPGMWRQDDPVKMPKPTAADKDRFHSLVPETAGVEVKAMFGQLGAFVNGNMFAGLFGSTIGVKLSEAALAEARK